ncbi:MAG: enoyl-CoA hydratase-related protein [Gemmatimonadaceae bacterium]
MQNRLVLVESAGSVMRLTLNRPDVLNSFNAEMSGELHSALADAAASREVRCVLLTGAGRAFCAGQDLSAVPPSVNGKFDLGAMVRATYNPVIKAIREIEKPVVCAVNGVAAGAGANIAIACDIVIAAESASFIQSFSKIGLVPDSGGTFFLPRSVGLPMATAMMLLGEKIPAQRAHEMGMIYRVCSSESLMPESMALATKLAEMPTRGLGLTKRLLNTSLSSDLNAQLAAEEGMQRDAGHTSDFTEGVAAFKEKRQPRFTGE